MIWQIVDTSIMLVLTEEEASEKIIRDVIRISLSEPSGWGSLQPIFPHPSHVETFPWLCPPDAGWRLLAASCGVPTFVGQMQQRMTVAGPWYGTDDFRTSSKSCGTVRCGLGRGEYMMSWLGAVPERDLTSNFADDVGLHCNGDGWGGCADEVGTCEESRCHIWVDPWSPGFHDAADELLRALLGSSTCRTGWCYFSLNARRHVWIQWRPFAAEVWAYWSCWGNAKSQSNGSHKSQSQSPGWHSNDWASSAAPATLSDTGFLLQNRAYELDCSKTLPSTAVYFH